MPRVKRAISVCLLIVVAVGAMVLAGRLGLRPEPQMTRFLSSPSTLERLAERDRADQANETGEAKSPLVVQADAFARYLNPPEPPRRTPPPPKPRATRAEAAPVAAASAPPKLRLAGISYHRSKPAESKALVWDTGGGQRWVAQGAGLGHLTIRQINRGSIVYEDAAGVHELPLELDATPATPVMPVRKPQEQQSPGGGSEIAVVAREKEEVRPVEAEPPSIVEAGVEELRVLTVAGPRKTPVPPVSTSGRRARPVRSVARRG
jgi:hypothetical protein